MELLSGLSHKNLINRFLVRNKAWCKSNILAQLSSTMATLIDNPVIIGKQNFLALHGSISRFPIILLLQLFQLPWELYPQVGGRVGILYWRSIKEVPKPTEWFQFDNAQEEVGIPIANIKVLQRVQEITFLSFKCSSHMNWLFFTGHN